MAIGLSAILGWGGFTWRRAEHAKEIAQEVAHKVDRIELKVAEDYLTKKEFEQQMDRLFSVLGEMKENMAYITERVDFHVSEQSKEIAELRSRRSRKLW